MRRRGKLLVGVLTTVLAVAVGCTERAALTLPEASAPALDRATKTTEVHRSARALERTAAHDQSVSVTARIGKKGGIIELPGTGLLVYIPENSLMPPGKQNYVDITVSSVPGRFVAYNFEPHGLKFRNPIYLVQSFAGTGLELNPGLASQMKGAYYDVAPDAEGVSDVTEVYDVGLDTRYGRLFFPVEHFSGYLVAAGVKDR